MITRNENGVETRSQYLQRVCIAFLRENWEAQECTVNYDETTCDGHCLADDLENALMEDSPANAPCSLVPMICITCHHWEPKGDPTLANGYCQIFNKPTNKSDGLQCTAWEKIHLENADCGASGESTTLNQTGG